MPSFGDKSSKNLAGAHPKLQAVMHEAIKVFDFIIMDSQRGREGQEKAFREGHSKAHFGQSAHNWAPSIALDIAPAPLDWNNRKAFIELSKVIMPIAKRLAIPLRWGGDWNQNGILTDEHLSDLPHYELHPWRDWAKASKLFGT
jgi:peptidoglycan L-alanyl-D-glutamate endopeptidase CwlK